MLIRKLTIFRIIAFTMFFVNVAAAAPLTFNVDGVISDASNQPLEAASVTFSVQIKNSSETCLLYQENFPVSMTGSNGYFSLVIGKQTNTIAGGATLDKVLSNESVSIPGQSCSYTPVSANETRKIVVGFNDGLTSQVFSTQEIQSVPYAVEAGQATKFTSALSGDVTGNQSATVITKLQGNPIDLTGIANGKILKYQSGAFVVADDATGTNGITALTGDVTAAGVGSVNATIGVGKVTSSHIFDGTILAGDMDFTGTNAATTSLVLKDSSGKFLTATCATTGHVMTWTAVGWSCQAPAASGMSNALAAGKVWVGNISGGAEAFTLSGDISSVSATGAVTLNKTTSALANTVLSLDGSSVGTMSGLALVNTGTVTLSASTSSSTYGLKFPAAAPTGSQIMQVDALGNLTWIATPSFSMPALTAGKIWIGDAGNVATAQSVAGDATLSQSGNLVLKNTGTAGTYFKVMTDAQGRVTSGGTLASGDVVSALGYTPSSNNLASTQVWIGNASGGAEPHGLSGDVTINNVGLVTLKNTGTAGAYSKVTTDAQGRVIAGSALASGDVTSALTYTPVNRTGDTMTGALNFSGNDITTTGNITMAANKYFQLSTNGTDGGVTGQMWLNGGIIKYYDGSTVKSLGVAGAGITAFNGATGAVQTLGVGTSGTDVGMATAGDTHTINIPTASASNRGALSSSDWSTFNSKRSNSLASTQVWIGNASGGAEPHGLSGDVTINNVGLVTLKNTGTAGAYSKVTTDAQGRVIAGSALASGDVVTALGFTPAASGSGVANFNGSTLASQSFAIPGTAGNAPAWSTNTGTGVHTLDIPMAAASGSVTAGLLSNAQYVALNSKQSNTLTSSQIWIGNGTNGAEARGLSGDVTISNIGLVTLKNTGTVGTYFKVVTDAQGRVASGATLASGDVVTALGFTPASGSSITSINGSTVASQSFAVPGTAGTAPAWAVNTGTGLHTLNIPMASTTSVTAGLISKADYDTFNNKLSATVTTPTSGQYLTYNGSAWVNSLLSVNLATQVTGTLPVANGGTGAATLATGSLVVGNGTSAVTGLAPSTAGNVLYVNGSTWTSGTPDTAGLVNKAGAQIIAGAKTFTSPLTMNAQSEVRLADSDSSNYIALRSPATVGANVTLTFPSTAGSSGQVLSTDGAGVLSWISPGGGGTVTNVATGTGLTGGPITGSGTISLADTSVTAGTYGSATQVGTFTVDAQGRLTSAANVTLNAVSKSGGDTITASTSTVKPLIIKGAASQSVNLFEAQNSSSTVLTSIDANGKLMTTNFQMTGGSPAAGKVLTSDATGNASWTTPAASGITTLNGLSSVTQSFVIGSSGNLPAFTSTGSAHTLDIPMAAASGTVTAGLLSNAQYVTLNSKQSNTLTGGQVWVGNSSNGAQARALSGDVFSVTDTGLVTVLKSTSGTANQIVALDGTSVGTMSGLKLPSGAYNTTLTAATTAISSYVLRLPATQGALNQIMQNDGFGNLSWVSNVPSVNNTAALTNGKMWLGSGSNVATEVTMAGDATITNAGVLTLKNTGTVGTYAKVVTDAQGRVTSGSILASGDVMAALGYAPVNKAGDIMTGTLEVSGNIQTNSGQVYASQNLVSTGATVDFNTGNVQIVQSPGGTALTLNNMKDGGSYTVIITDPTSRQYTFSTCTNSRYVPANDLTTAGTQSIYTILKVTIGGATHCYISWVSGF